METRRGQLDRDDDVLEELFPKSSSQVCDVETRFHPAEVDLTKWRLAKFSLTAVVRFALESPQSVVVVVRPSTVSPCPFHRSVLRR